MTTACDAVISLAEKSLYDVILDDLYTFYGADTEVTWTGFSVQPEGKMSEEYFEEVRESGDLFAAAEKSFRNAIDGVKVLHMNKTDTPFNETDRWVGAVGLMQHGKTLDQLLAAGWEVGVIWQDGRAFHGQHLRVTHSWLDM